MFLINDIYCSNIYSHFCGVDSLTKDQSESFTPDSDMYFAKQSTD